MEILESEFKKIDDLLIDSEGDYTDEEPAPTPESIRLMKAHIHHAVYVFGEDFLKPKYIPDFKGGIEAIWRKGKKVLQLISRPNGVYMFWKEGEHYRQIQIGGRRALLISKLVWLKN